jgi:hypothetical protein
MLPDGISPKRIKKETIGFHFFDFEAVVKSSNPRARNRLSKRLDYKEGAQGFMPNLFLYEIAACESVSQGASGLLAIHQKNVSTVPGCINRVLRSTSR